MNHRCDDLYEDWREVDRRSLRTGPGRFRGPTPVRTGESERRSRVVEWPRRQVTVGTSRVSNLGLDVVSTSQAGETIPAASSMRYLMGQSGMGVSQSAGTRIGSRRCQSQCGSGSIPDDVLHCIALDVTQCLWPGGPKSRRSSGARALGACTQPDTSSHALHMLRATAHRHCRWCIRGSGRSRCLEGIVEKSAARTFIRRNRHDEERGGPSSRIRPGPGRGKALESRPDCDGCQTVPRAHGAQYQEKANLHSKERGMGEPIRSRGRRRVSQAPERGEA